MLVNCNLWNEKTYKLWGGEKKKEEENLLFLMLEIDDVTFYLEHGCMVYCI